MEHHAYYVEGAQSLLPALVSDIRAREHVEAHDPNFLERVYEKFGIDEARELQALSQLKSINGSAIFVIGISSITTEAQQALLKLFEEPQQGTTYVLLLPHGTLIPTLRSRFLEYPYDIKAPVRSQTEAKKFLSLGSKERSAFVAALLKDEEGVREKVRNFLNSLEVELQKNIATDKKARTGLEDIAHVRSYVTDRSPSLKMLLEHLATTLPKS
jgi:hypothetical protein